MKEISNTNQGELLRRKNVKVEHNRMRGIAQSIQGENRAMGAQRGIIPEGSRRE